MANTIAPKDLAQESDATRFPTALVIIWNNGGELKKANISQVVNANILKDSTPIQGSTRLITSGGVWNFTYSKANLDGVFAIINSAKANKSEVYTREQVNVLLNGKADKSETYTIIQVDALLNAKANVADVYAKTEVYSKTEIDYLANVLVTELGKKENVATEDSFADNTSITLADNTIYTASEPISVLSLEAQASGTSVVSFDTASSGSITITTIGITFQSQPEFGNNEHWEVAIRNGYAVYSKFDLV